MTRSFVKTSSDSPVKLMTLCMAIAIGLVLNGAPSQADGTEYAAVTTLIHLPMSAAC